MIMIKTGLLFCGRYLISSCTRPSIVNAVKHECLASIRVQSVRNTSFFNRLSQNELWKGTTSVSNAGRRKGRGKGRRLRRNLNIGQKIGYGKVKVRFPGLNFRIFQDKNRLNEIEKMPKHQESPKNIGVPLRRSRKVHPLDRGFSGGTIKGRKLDPISSAEGKFDNFQCILLDSKLAILQTALFGKKRRSYTLVGIGNGDGVIGFGRAKTLVHKTSVNLSKHRATRRLLTIDLIEKHTVNHDFFSHYGYTKVFVYKRPEGYGLVCHRLIKAVCKLVGIENLYAKVEGPCNTLHIIRAFVTGLLRQKTYQEIANEKKLHLVEFREECLNFPRVLASPNECLSLEEARKNPVTFEEYIMGGRLFYQREKEVPFFMKHISWKFYLKRTEYRRNHAKVRRDLMLKYGDLRSHLTDIYPECQAPERAGFIKKKES